MNYSNPANLAVLACPGGEVFADEVITCLKKCYYRHFKKAVSGFARRYNMDMEEVIKKVNFINEVNSPSAILPENVLKFHVPRFKVPARFTLFSNGEIKSEILESIRGKDIYIVQDVENHYPLKFNDGTVTKSLSVNDHLMTIFVTVDAVKQAGAERVTLVVPIYP
jgi:ribose-phosphate pyrophosphokinase